MGDVILALPAARALKLSYPDAKVVFLCRSYTASLLTLCLWLDGIIEIDKPVSQVLEEIKRHHFDVAVCLFPEPKVVGLLTKAKIPLRVGTGTRFRSFRFQRRIFEHRKWALRHEVFYNLNIAKLLDIKGIPEPLWEWQIHEEANARVSTLFTEFQLNSNKPLVVLHPGSGKSAENWSLQKFAELANDLKNDGLQVVFTGDQEEKPAIDVISRTVNGISNLAGELSIPELAVLFRRSNLVVANSTGPLHLANALGTPVIGLYPMTRSMHPKRWGPLGQMEHVLTPKSEDGGMSTIPVETVVKMAKEIIGGNKLKVVNWHRPPPFSVLITITCPWWNAAAFIAIGLASGLKTRGHRVWVMGRANTPALEKARDLGLETIALPLHFKNPVSLFKNIQQIKSILEKLPITLVNAHCPMGHSQVAAALVGMGRNTPLIRTVCDPRLPKGNLVNRWLHLKRTDAVVVTCEPSKRRYIESFPDLENKVFVIPGGIDPTPFLQIERTETNYENQEIWVGVISRLSPVKGHDIFLRAAAIVSKQAPKVRFLISGEAAQLNLDDLRRQAELLGIADRVRIQSRVNDVKELLKKLHLGVVSSVGSETMCRIALEMMASGLPVVGTSVNAVGETIQDGVTGFVVPPHDPNQLADALLKLINSSELRKKMGMAGRYRVKSELSLDRMVERTEELYHQVLCLRTSEYLPTIGGTN
jgi:heptosyltransferase-3